ncbi:MAG: hypothetical protein CML66_28850 [Rhodobacteraceae bacterium]|nr:hypothetical protein [Paracoccaceae bacterium]
MELSETVLRNAVWEGRLTGASASEPAVSVTWLDRPVEGIDLTPEGDGRWRLRVPVPTEAVADGVQTFVIADAASGTRLASFTLIAGAPAADDIRAEIELLRAELDMLKSAFRRHCVETA